MDTKSFRTNFLSQVLGNEMLMILRPEGLTSGSAKANVAMEANKIRANLIFLVASVTCKKIVKLQKIEPNGFANFRKLATYCLVKN
jgi:hypothetical protein